jgi:methionyl-tRNA formyltransferase
MGSPEFAVPSLRALVAGEHEVALVVSQPDRPAGRNRRLTPPAAAAFAGQAGLALHQPVTLRGEGERAPLLTAAPDLIVVAAYGLILPRAVLELPRYGCLNVHPSLLPRYRGASPIQAALLNGDDETGVTIIKLIGRMDAGPILAQERTPIGAGEDALALEPRLAELGAQLLVETLGPWVAGELVAQEQDEAQATYCQRLTPSNAELDWQRPARQLANLVRAFRGRTDAYSSWRGRRLRVLAAEALEMGTGDREPGTVFVLEGDRRERRPLVATGEGALALDLVALEGRPASTGSAFLNGYSGLIGARLGDEG